MSSEFLDTAVSQIRELISRLQSPILDLPTLLTLLTAPLDSLGLLAPQYRKYNSSPLPHAALHIPRHLPPLQRALLEHVIPTWGAILAEQHLTPLVDCFFVPDAFAYAKPAAGAVALCAYTMLLALPPTPHALRLLVALSRAYPIDRVYAGTRGIAWEDAVRNVLTVPAKVANALAGREPPPPELETGAYLGGVCVRTEVLVAQLAPEHTKESVAALVYLLSKLVNVGAFPSAPPSTPSQPSFFAATLDTIRGRLTGDDTCVATYSGFWSELLLAVPSIFTLQGILASLFSHLSVPKAELDGSPRVRGAVKREALLLRGFIGRLEKGRKDLWDAVTAVILGRNWTQMHARVFVCWAAGAQKGSVDEEALSVLLANTIDIWSSPDHVRHSLLGKHRYVTLLLLTTISYLPPSSPALNDLVFSPRFVQSISQYIEHLDPVIRRCGMLVAEELARRTGKSLDFDDWDGDDGGKPWVRAARALTTETDANAEALSDNEAPLDEENGEAAPLDVEDLLTEDIIQPSKPILTLADAGAVDSDDELTGYASPSSSRSPSPTASELREIEADPTLRVGKTKIARPVYLAQLGEMIRSTSGLKSEYETQEADKHEMALANAEELIRKKAGYGTELEENAVNLVYGLVGLQDNYEINDFSGKRQTALNALVACCPERAAPAIIEEFFKNQYSSEQRYVMLNSLALGAREIAGLPLPAAAPKRSFFRNRTAFPSKLLPPVLHDKYTIEASTKQIQGLLQGITSQTIENTRQENTPPSGLTRERRLRVQSPSKSKITEVQRPNADELAQQLRGARLAPKVQFTDVALECFICPLLNRFWLFLRDEQTREARTAQRDTLHRYRGAGAGLILSAPVLAHLLATLGVLAHASRNAPAWLAVVAPDALEMAVTLGTRPVSMGPDDDDDDEGAEGGGKEARVLTAALELALVVLDGCLMLDGGRALSLEHTALLLAAEEWAGDVFSRLEKGLLVRGGGGEAEGRLSKAAAGVILKAGEVSERWKRSMIDLTR